MKTARLPGTRGFNSNSNGFHPHNILVPVDFSRLSVSAARKAAHIALQYEAKVHLVSAVFPILLPFEELPPEMQEVNQRLRAESETGLEELRRELSATGVACCATTLLGRPWRVIADYARRTRCDLIVISTHGYTGPRHALLGSTAERIVQHAPCSVLVLR